jgi:5-methylthioadenosine/S-adenosylhomocysteine deaminase
MALILQGGAVLTVNAANDFLPTADIRIEGTSIAAIGAAGSLARPGDQPPTRL